MKTKEEIIKIAKVVEMDPLDCCYRYYFLSKQWSDILRKEVFKLEAELSVTKT